ncbi:hypothetical protein LX81_03200 [Palleronia aestuarii]|uniref:Uncharacterized protein n=1 Tax=Palleronia aestuarii TaxID=568105 RepID=A0A2W7PVR7_9RHOB|nr:hypothetical protein [Palleronia aestuarii]PZX13649.1 hypothetical protein LX81_03200 [Palleronia aestuarii]
MVSRQAKIAIVAVGDPTCVAAQVTYGTSRSDTAAPARSIPSPGENAKTIAALPETGSVGAADLHTIADRVQEDIVCFDGSKGLAALPPCSAAGTI